MSNLANDQEIERLIHGTIVKNPEDLSFLNASISYLNASDNNFEDMCPILFGLPILIAYHFQVNGKAVSLSNNDQIRLEEEIIFAL